MKLNYRHPQQFEGRKEIICGSNSPLEYLSYGRISLTPSFDEVKILSPERETVLICVKGQAVARLGSKTHDINFQDALYIPRACECVIEGSGEAELVEGSAPSEIDRDPVFSSFSEIKEDAVRHRAKGDPQGSTFRDSYVHFGPDFNASRILMGFARMRPGNWSSWPPHEHRSKLEEIYIYYDMPSPAFGIQLVYEDLENPTFCGVVKEGDAVIVSEGYHPCISAPQYPANYVWIVAARNQTERTSAPNTHPDFA